MFRALILFAGGALALAACNGDDDRPKPRPPAAVDPMNPANVEVGPIIARRNYSIGLPLRPAPHPDGWSVNISPTEEPHYITWRHGSLRGKHTVIITGRIEAAEGVKIYPVDSPEADTALTLYFASSENEWGENFTRWWAKDAAIWKLAPGPFTAVASLDGDEWGSVQGGFTSTNAPRRFAEAIEKADRVGFTLGWVGGRGHGVRATGPAKLVITSIRVE